jgi:GntR family transcriptional regulator
VNIIISTASNKPIYEQITAQIKRMIISGELRCGTALPSMRLLAKELRISVITTKRAYTDLERDGFITTAVGKGSFVAEKNHDDRCRQQQTLARDQFCAAVETAKDAGITREELQETLDLTYTKE